MVKKKHNMEKCRLQKKSLLVIKPLVLSVAGIKFCNVGLRPQLPVNSR